MENNCSIYFQGITVSKFRVKKTTDQKFLKEFKSWKRFRYYQDNKFGHLRQLYDKIKPEFLELDILTVFFTIVQVVLFPKQTPF